MNSGLKFVIKRLLVMIPLLFAVTFASYLLITVTPGDPMAMYVGQDQLRQMTPTQREERREALGLNRPIIVRYFDWLDDILHGSFGTSFKTGRPIAQEIGQRIGITVGLNMLTLALTYLIGIPLGIYLAKHRNGILDNAVMLYSYVGISLPSFWLSIMAITLFAVKLKWLPALGLSDLTLKTPTAWQEFVDTVKHLIMPVGLTVLTGLGSMARSERNLYLDVINQDYVRTARAKGLPERKVKWGHAYRNVMLPLASEIGGSLAGLIGGSYIMETIFSIPGLGAYSTNAILDRDYPVIMATLLMSSVLVMVGYLVSDILYCVVDPRIRVQ